MSRCRSCGREDLEIILSLGLMPLANALVAPEDLGRPEPRYPLDLAFCPGCALVQITSIVDPDILFREYLYFSSFSETMLRHAQDLCTRLIRERRLGPSSFVLEIASNDGYLLQYYKASGVPVLGVEPARNVAAVARRDRGIETISEFFDVTLARRLVAEGQRPDVIHAHNVLAHVSDVEGVIAGIGVLLAPGGVAVIEVPYVKEMIDRLEFDTIYHEHICYFSLMSLGRLLARHQLIVADVEQLSIHGGSLRLFVTRASEGWRATAVAELLAEEERWGANRAEFYRGFASQVERRKGEIVQLLGSLKAQGHRIAGYGAAAKGVTLLNALGVGADTLDFVADRSPYKQGRFLPGLRIPIRQVETILASRPDYLLLLAWNLAVEIIEQQSEYHRQGGRFILPLPELRVV